MLVDTLGVSEDPVALAHVGSLLVVLSNEGGSHHYAEVDDILLGSATWTEVTGYNASGSPNAMFAPDPLHIWVVGDGGYVYLLTDIAAAVTSDNIQDAGSATDQDLAAIHGFDQQHLVAVGAQNAVIFTADGLTWAAVTGPAPAVDLTTVWMKSQTEWFVGSADGKLWYTRNGGATWSEKGFPGSGTGTVQDVKFSNDTVGFMSHTTASGKGRILRTIDGGYSWVVAPEGNTSVPLADRFNKLAVCPYDVNLVFAGGLADDAIDGIIVKGYGS